MCSHERRQIREVDSRRGAKCGRGIRRDGLGARGSQRVERLPCRTARVQLLLAVPHAECPAGTAARLSAFAFAAWPPLTCTFAHTLPAKVHGEGATSRDAPAGKIVGAQAAQSQTRPADGRPRKPGSLTAYLPEVLHVEGPRFPRAERHGRRLSVISCTTAAAGLVCGQRSCCTCLTAGTGVERGAGVDTSRGPATRTGAGGCRCRKAMADLLRDAVPPP